MNYPSDYDRVLRYSTMPGAGHADAENLLRQLASPAHFHARLGLPTGDLHLRRIASDALRDTGRTAEADLLDPDRPGPAAIHVHYYQPDVLGPIEHRVRPLRLNDLPPFHWGYIGTAAELSGPNRSGGSDPAQIDEPTIAEMARDAEHFRHRHRLDAGDDIAGYHFYLDRQGHGHGAWGDPEHYDARYDGIDPDALSDDARRYGEYDLYRDGEDRIYGMGSGRRPE